MTNDTSSFDFSMNLKPGAPGLKKTKAERWIAPPFKAQQINAEAALISVPGYYPPTVLNLQLLQILHSCDQFRTVDQHKNHILERMNWGVEYAGAVREALEHLIEQGLLHNQENVLDQWVSAKPSPTATPKLAHCFIRTANRPQALTKLLASLSQEVDGQDLNLWVLDDSKDPSVAVENKAVLAAFADQWPALTHYVNRDKIEDLVRRIANQSGASSENLGWLLKGDPSNTALTYGTTFNVALLLAAGHRFILLDDDTTLDSYVFEDAHMGVGVSSDLNKRLRFLAPQIPERDQFPKAKVDLLAAHAQWLGQSIGDVALNYAPSHKEFLSNIDVQLMHALSDQSKLRFTVNGLLGDPGTGALHWILTQKPADLHELCISDPKTVEKLLQRKYARASLGTQITIDQAFMSTVRGIDNRELLLPTLPQGRGEDLFFGAVTHFLYPGTLTANLPFMSPHRIGEERPWTEADIHRPTALNQKHNPFTILSDWIAGIHLPSGHFLARLDHLRGWLVHLSTVEQSTLEEMLVEYVNETQGEFLKALNDTSSALEAPDWLKDIYGTVIQDTLAVDEHYEQSLDQLARPIREIATAYAGVLNDWVLAWRWCCQHDMVEELP